MMNLYHNGAAAALSEKRPASHDGLRTRVLGHTDELPEVLGSKVIDEVIIVTPLERAEIEALARQCATRGVVLRVLLDLPEVSIGSWNAEKREEGVYILSLAAVPRSALAILVKRAIDIAGALAGLTLCGLLWWWYGPRLRRETGGSALFRQRRVGRNGRRFTLYKFQTMRADAEQLKAQLKARNEMNGAIFKLKDDPRVTSAGRRLRRRHLDEFPQFWNVLRGEMSLVGTRPPTEDEFAIYEQHHYRRLSMKPGLTGLWQLNGNGAVKDFEDVVKLDCEYIDNWSLWLDAKILAKTVTKVLCGDAW
jgi:lipopolysaccharide/colanic/teichoic acid biosynthesis glycosyltransferase